MKKIGIASDHAGFDMKEFIVGFLASQGYEVFDFGCYSEEPCDYPDVGHPLGDAITGGEFERGISVCGSGVGISIVVNKHRGVRGALCWEPEIAKLCRQHNDANVLCLPARFMDNETAQECVSLFLETPFEGGRHQKRIDKIEIASSVNFAPAKGAKGAKGAKSANPAKPKPTSKPAAKPTQAKSKPAQAKTTKAPAKNAKPQSAKQ